MNPLVKRDIPRVTWDNGSAPNGAAPVSASNTPEGLTHLSAVPEGGMAS